MRIYYADDDEDDIFLFTLAVNEINESYQVVPFKTGLALLNALSETNTLPHTVFMDINMPMRNGLECLRDIRADHRYQNLSVHILSTSPPVIFKQQAEDNGANSYIQKASDFEQYKKRIEQAIEQAKNNN